MGPSAAGRSLPVHMPTIEAGEAPGAIALHLRQLTMGEAGQTDESSEDRDR